MTCCGVKSVGSGDLKTASTIMGYILIVSDVIWLGFKTKSYYNYFTALRSVEGETRLIVETASFIIGEAALILALMFTIILLVEILKNAREFFWIFYTAVAVFCSVQWIVFVVEVSYLGVHFVNAVVAVEFALSILTILLAVVFLVLVWIHVRRTDPDRDTRPPKPTAKQSKLGIYYVPPFRYNRVNMIE